MIVPSKNQKTYGVLHTENYFSFLGFCKKVNSDKIQKVDVLIDNILIDTIVADKHIEKIEDIYELEGFGFTYDLPNRYIGQENLINFRNHETKEDLQNSPHELIQANHPKFNEMSFLNSLFNEIDEEKTKNKYCSNSIGFLAVEENIKDIKFIDYIKELMVKFPEIKVNALYFNYEQKELCENIFNFNEMKNLQYLPINSIYNLIEEIEVYIHNASIADNFILWKSQQILLYNTDNIVVINFNPEIFNLTLHQHSLNMMKPGFPYYDNPHYFGFDDSDIKLSKGNLHKLISSKLPHIENFNIDLSKSLKQNSFDHLNIALNNSEYKKYINNLHLKFKELMEQKNE